MKEIYVEKYRPQSVKEICGQKKIKSDLLSFVKNNDIPHLLFYGAAGIGKTTAAFALGKDILKESFGVNFLEMNASDSRKIDDVRNKIKYYAKQMPIDAPFKIILLDECDAMTPQAQDALKRIIEKFSKTCRFILCCNNINKVIPPIISRCAGYNFMPLEIEDINDRLLYITTSEGVKSEIEAISYIAKNCNGDIRRAITRLQSVASQGSVTMDNVYSDTIEGSFLFVIQSIFKDKNWQSGRLGITQYKREGGDFRELLLKIHDYIIEHEKLCPAICLAPITRIIREADKNILYGVAEQIEIDVFLFDILDALKIPK